MMKHREDDPNDHEAEKRHRWVRYNPDLNPGSIIQIVMLASAILFGYAALKETVSLTQARTIVIEERAAEQKKEADASNKEFRADVKEIGNKVSDLKTKIDLLDLKISQSRK